MATDKTKTLARFHDLAAARRCLAALRRRQLFNPGMRIELQNEQRGHGELPIAFTHSWVGFFKGGALGGLAGLLFGMAFTLFQIEQLSALFLAPFVLFGAVMGAFGGALVGAMNPSNSIELTERQGGVALLVESPDADDVEWARRAFSRFGGMIVGEAPPSSNGELPEKRGPSESRA